MGEELFAGKAEGVSAVEEGFALDGEVFTWDKFTLAWHGDAAFSGVPPASIECNVGFLEVAAADAGGYGDESEFRAKIAGSCTLDGRFGIEESSDLAT